jgi:hypothetical protein
MAGVSALIPVSIGPHQLQFVTATGTSSTVAVTPSPSSTAIVVASGTSTSLSGTVLIDTGSVVPAGKSKLRVAHLAASAGNIEIWRTQPDFQTPVHIMTPFPYLATSPYLQSDPGIWEVFATAAGSTTKLATTGPINIGDRERRTVALLDSAGVLLFRVIVQ